MSRRVVPERIMLTDLLDPSWPSQRESRTFTATEGYASTRGSVKDGE